VLKRVGAASSCTGRAQSSRVRRNGKGSLVDGGQRTGAGLVKQAVAKDILTQMGRDNLNGIVSTGYAEP